MKAILFDLGNTLLKVNPHESGPMVSWTSLEIVSETISDTLGKLSSEFPLYIATNAKDSTTQQIREALDRVDLGGYFEKVFAARDLGITKETPEFYQRILDELNMASGELIMVGDDYVQDVLVPASLGIKTGFFNFKNGFYANGVAPIHSVEMNRFEDLTFRLAKRMYPSIDECMLWLLEYGISYGILQHVQTVAVLSYDLAVRIAATGENVDPILAHRSGLLHDIDKLHPEGSRERHGKLGAEILRGKGFEDVAEIIQRHTISPNWNPGEVPETWEQKIVFYADKLVKGNEIVSLDERIRDLIKRYPDSQDVIEKNKGNIVNLQDELMTCMELTPQEYLSTVKQKLHGAKRLPGNS